MRHGLIFSSTAFIVAAIVMLIMLAAGCWACFDAGCRAVDRWVDKRLGECL